MVDGLLAKKLGMTTYFSPEGEAVPVTVLEAGPCYVIQKKKEDKEGYNAVQLGFIPKKDSKVKKPLQGHFKAAGKGCFYHLKEFRIEKVDEINLGDTIGVDIFSVGEKVNVTGRSKGRGFAGVMKRHGFAGGRSSHGSRFHRAPGSIGCSADPSRVFKGKKLPGHMGASRVTVRGLEVVDVRPEHNLLIVKGAVPGHRNSIVIIKKAKKS